MARLVNTGRVMPTVRDFEREQITDGTRRVLCAFASGDSNRPLPTTAVDWAEVVDAIRRNGLIGLAHRHLEAQQDADVPDQVRDVIKRARIAAVFAMADRYKKVRQVVDGLHAAGLDFMVVKGPAVAHCAYPDSSARGFGDLDIVVHERDRMRTHHALELLGFSEIDGQHQPPPRLFPNAVTYELRYHHPTWNMLVEVHFEDLLNAGLRSRGFERVWESAEKVEAAGTSFKVMCLEDQLVHLCAHAHFHGYTRLIWFSDLAFIVREHGSDLNWNRVVETVRVEQCAVPVYFTLRFLEQICGVRVPAEVLAAVRPDVLRRWFHECYQPEANVVSLQPMPRPDFSFYFQPLLKRLLPDLLVMGRRREKLACLWRVIVPPPAWLRYYYRLPAGATVAPHYVLHPLKLGYHYLEEVLAAVRCRAKMVQR